MNHANGVNNIDTMTEASIKSISYKIIRQRHPPVSVMSSVLSCFLTSLNCCMCTTLPFFFRPSESVTTVLTTLPCAMSKCPQIFHCDDDHQETNVKFVCPSGSQAGGPHRLPKSMLSPACARLPTKIYHIIQF